MKKIEAEKWREKQETEAYEEIVSDPATQKFMKFLAQKWKKEQGVE